MLKVKTKSTPVRHSLFLCFFLMSVPCLVISAQDISIIPVPVSQQLGQGSFEISATTALVVPSKHPTIQKIAAYFSDKIKPATGLALKTAETPAGSTIQFVLNAKPDTKLGNEGYLLETSLSN